MSLSSNYIFQISEENTPVNDGRLFCLTKKLEATASTEILTLKVAENAGAGVVQLKVRLKNGKIFNLFGDGGANSIEQEYQNKKHSCDPYASNVFFQKGIMAALWPLANRLTGKKSTNSDALNSTVLGRNVVMPANNGSAHLHGLLFNKVADKVTTTATAESATLMAEFHFGKDNPFWCGECSVTVTHILKNGSYEFWLKSKNTGDQAMPVGGGSHPYFHIPSNDSTAIKLKIPARSLVEIENHTSVLPTGKTIPIERDGEYDFSSDHGVTLQDRYLDNLWVDLLPDSEGFAYAEISDDKTGFRARITGLTKNIIGIQAYAPKSNFAAVELVTNLPDPREDLWKEMPTGMQLLQPGEVFHYGVKIEVMENLSS